MNKHNEIDVLDVLLDDENKDPITLVDDKGHTIHFEQIAVIPHEGIVYCVLRPLDKLPHVSEDEAIVFKVVEANGAPPTLMVETDEKLAITIFHQYYDLLEESLK